MGVFQDKSSLRTEMDGFLRLSPVETKPQARAAREVLAVNNETVANSFLSLTARAMLDVRSKNREQVASH